MQVLLQIPANFILLNLTNRCGKAESATVDFAFFTEVGRDLVDLGAGAKDFFATFIAGKCGFGQFQQEFSDGFVYHFLRRG